MPSFERPVARELVHRQSTSEVLPTDFEVRASDEFSVALQWPRRHGFFSTRPPDSAIIAETIRQVTILTCHLGYDVPLDARFLMTGLGFEQLGTSPRHVSGEALELNAFVSCVDVRRTLRGELRSVQMNIELAGRDGGLGRRPRRCPHRWGRRHTSECGVRASLPHRLLRAE